MTVVSVRFLCGFNPRPPKRTLCLYSDRCVSTFLMRFQSTSSEEDVVSPPLKFKPRLEFVSIHVLRRGRCVSLKTDNQNTLSLFQSTSSEEDVVSVISCSSQCVIYSFNPRPPKRTLCHDAVDCAEHGIFVSIHVLRRGRCVS